MQRQNHLITGLSFSHHTTSVNNFDPLVTNDYADVLTTLTDHDAVTEAFVLHTCSRVEAYVVTETRTTAKDVLTDYSTPLDPDEQGVWLGHEESLRHLMRVACGLESIVTGEDQIIGQVKAAYNTASDAGTLGRLLDPGVLKAIHVGERARTTTAINDGIVSLSSAAAEIARDKCDLTSGTVLIIGAGKMAIQTAEHLAPDTNHVIVSNRTVGNAESVAAQIGDETTTTVTTLTDLPDTIADVDIVITATGSPDPIITADTLTPTSTSHLPIIDIAQPRDTEPGIENYPAVERIGLDDLNETTEQTCAEREDAVTAVEALIQDEHSQLLTQYKRKQADAVIQGMYRGAEQTKETELDHAVNRLEAAGGLTPEQREILGEFGDALVNQLLAAPTESLRDAAETDDWETIHTAVQLFDPHTTVGDEPPPTTTDSMFDGEVDAPIDVLPALKREDSYTR